MFVVFPFGSAVGAAACDDGCCEGRTGKDIVAGQLEVLPDDPSFKQGIP